MIHRIVQKADKDVLDCNTSGTFWWFCSIDTYTNALDGLFGTLITYNVFMVSFMVLSATQTVGLNGRMHRENELKGVWKEVVLAGFLGNIQPFSWRD